jgi:hypothetical protein
LADTTNLLQKRNICARIWTRKDGDGSEIFNDLLDGKANHDRFGILKASILFIVDVESLIICVYILDDHTKSSITIGGSIW